MAGQVKAFFQGRKRWYHLLAAALLGVLLYLLVYGTVQLNPTYDTWIYAGYDEGDIQQHYAGWNSFRNSPWAYPLGLASDMAVGTGTYITYTDSIPWVAIFFKLFRAVLPKTFQYFGIYVLLCYVLQSVAAFLVLEDRTNSIGISYLGTVLFGVSPILMERAFRHTALASHWLILFSILLYFYHREGKKYIGCRFLLLQVLAIGIHPYFLPATFIFDFVCVVEELLRKKWLAPFGFAARLGITAGAGVLIGALGTGIDTHRPGYGFYCMNLNALFNPSSKGEYTWSMFLPKRPLGEGTYEGFNYLGVGVMVLLLLVAVLAIRFVGAKRILKTMKRYWCLLAAMVFLTLFALSTTWIFDDKILFSIFLRYNIRKLFEIFRSSGRIFFSVYYMLFVALVASLWKLRKALSERWVIGILAICVGLQLADLHQVFAEKHRLPIQNAEKMHWIEEIPEEVTDQTTKMLLDGFEGDMRTISAWASKNGMATYYSVANTGDYSGCDEMRNAQFGRIFEENMLRDTLIITTNSGVAERYLSMGDAALYQCRWIFWEDEAEGYFIYPAKGENACS